MPTMRSMRRSAWRGHVVGELPVPRSSPLCIIHAASEDDADGAIERVRRAIRIGDGVPAERPVVIERVVQ
jgi:thymidine phosphorylase